MATPLEDPPYCTRDVATKQMSSAEEIMSGRRK